MFKISHKINPFGPMSCLETCDIRVIFLSTFFLCPRNYYNDNNRIGTKKSSDMYYIWVWNYALMTALWFALSLDFTLSISINLNYQWHHTTHPVVVYLKWFITHKDKNIVSFVMFWILTGWLREKQDCSVWVTPSLMAYVNCYQFDKLDI